MEGLPSFCYFVFRQVCGRLWIFSERCIVLVSRTTTTKRQAFHLLAVSCMINTAVSKSHIQIHTWYVPKIERGIAKQRLCQRLGWPSSYVAPSSIRCITQYFHQSFHHISTYLTSLHVEEDTHTWPACGGDLSPYLRLCRSFRQHGLDYEDGGKKIKTHLLRSATPTTKTTYLGKYVSYVLL